jgi:hypothetical protein
MEPPLRYHVPVRILATLALAWAALGLVPQLGAQDPGIDRPQHAVVLQAGQWYADVNGMIVSSIRTEFPLGRSGRWLAVPGVTYAHYTLGSPVPRVDLLAPEALVHLQLGQGWLRPYVGGGAGLVLVNMFHTVDPVVSLGAGVRADLTPDWGARAEVDTRAFGQFNAGSVGWSVGLARRF